MDKKEWEEFWGITEEEGIVEEEDLEEEEEVKENGQEPLRRSWTAGKNL